MTLVFIGEVARDRISGLVAALKGIEAPAFRIELDQAACWRHNRIAYLAPSRPPGALLDLVAVLNTRLDASAIDHDRRPYKPHVSIVRKAECATLPSGRQGTSLDWDSHSPIMWPASDFVLVESAPTASGIDYVPLSVFPLREQAL